jgi:hypothetical protein
VIAARITATFSLHQAAVVAGVIAVMSTCCPSSAAVPGPLETRSARCGDLHLRAVAGAAVVVGERRLFFDQTRDRAELPHLQVELSFASRVAVELDYALWLIAQHESASSIEPVEDGYGSGDLRIRTRFGALVERGWTPAVAIQVGVKLPNAPDRNGFGTDETDVDLGVLITKGLGPVDIHGNVALGILGDPTERAAQDDVLLLSLLIAVKPVKPVRLLAEVWAMPIAARNPPLATVRGGVGLNLRGVDLAFVAGVGMTVDSPRFVAGVDVGFDGSLRRATQGEH